MGALTTAASIAATAGDVATITSAQALNDAISAAQVTAAASKEVNTNAENDV